MLTPKKSTVKKPIKGKPGSSNKTLYKGTAFNKKGNLIDKYDVSSKKGDRNQYMIYADGKPVRTTYNPTTGIKTTSEMDTTGYSKGVKTYNVVTKTSKGKGKPTVTTRKVNRADVQNELGKMQNFKKKGGVVKSKKK
jgi:hypothetical protein